MADLNISGNWLDAAADVVAGIDDANCPEFLMRLLRDMVQVDSCSLVAYRDSAEPILLMEDMAKSWRENRMEDYLKGAYLLDPLYLHAKESEAIGLQRLRDLAPDAFEESEYYRAYYQYSHVADEVVFFAREGDVTLSLSIERRLESGAFSGEEISALQAVAPLVSAILGKHWSLVGVAHDSRAVDVGGALDAAFRNFGTSVLTDRECEVVHLVLRGHSTKSLAGRLGIAPATAKIHRRNIYEKLDISSQSELFHMFIDAVASHDGGAAQDPLARYM